MKKTFLAFLLVLAGATTLSAQSKSEIVKTGLNFGPLPAVAYDADKGFQLGAILQIYNYGDGHNYPNYDSKWYIEGSWFTKGSMLFQLRYDDKELIPGVRWSSGIRFNIDKAFDFYGLNGYQSYFNQNLIDMGKAGDICKFTPYYRANRTDFLFKTDFIGDIVKGLKWEAGLFANYQMISAIDRTSINKGKDLTEMFPTLDPDNNNPEALHDAEALTLFEQYKKAGLLGISDPDAKGYRSIGLRAGLVYDTRDKEGAPSKGIWAEGHVTLAPKYLSSNPYYRYSFTWRHYLPIVKNDVLTFAYRLNYEGNFGNSAPYYAMPFITNMGEKCDLEGMGGYNTVRGLMRCRVVGLDMATYNAEFRWRFVKFHIGKQNIALALNAFSDGTMVTRGIDLSPLEGVTDIAGFQNVYPGKLEGTGANIYRSDIKEIPHITFGGGFRFIMNNNFIVAAEYGMPLTHFMKNSPYYNQDGTGAFYLNIGYLF